MSTPVHPVATPLQKSLKYNCKIKHQQNIRPPRLRFTQSGWAKKTHKLLFDDRGTVVRALKHRGGSYRTVDGRRSRCIAVVDFCMLKLFSPRLLRGPRMQ